MTRDTLIGREPAAGQGSRPLRPARLGAFAVVLWLLLTAAGGFALHMSFDENVLTTSAQRNIRTTVVALVPERWAFFTKSPRSEGMQAYAPIADTDEWKQASKYPIFQSSNAFGWDRTVRAAGIEIGLLDMLGNQVSWQNCDASTRLPDCLRQVAADSVYPPIANTSPEPLLCGRIALVGITPGPWAYAAINQDQPTLRVKLMDVQC